MRQRDLGNRLEFPSIGAKHGHGFGALLPASERNGKPRVNNQKAALRMKIVSQTKCLLDGYQEDALHGLSQTHDSAGTPGSIGSEIRTMPDCPVLRGRISSLPWCVSMIFRLTVRPRPRPTLRVVKKGDGAF